MSLDLEIWAEEQIEKQKLQNQFRKATISPDGQEVNAEAETLSYPAEQKRSVPEYSDLPYGK